MACVIEVLGEGGDERRWKGAKFTKLIKHDIQSKEEISGYVPMMCSINQHNQMHKLFLL